MSGGKLAGAATVGIIYFVGGKLWFDATPLVRANNFGDIAFHELEHEQWWTQLVKKGIAPNTAYTEFPRGRVSFDRRNKEFRFLADPCILRRKNLVSAVLKRMNLPVRHTQIGTDGGYRCGQCERLEIAKSLKTREG
jgi:hypothetical protein